MITAEHNHNADDNECQEIFEVVNPLETVTSTRADHRESQAVALLLRNSRPIASNSDSGMNMSVLSRPMSPISPRWWASRNASNSAVSPFSLTPTASA